MPNGIDKNLIRLAISCAAFRRLHGEWPTQARLAPVTLWDLANLVDIDSWERLCSRLRLRTTSRAHMAVGNSNAHVVYEKLAPRAAGDGVQEALAWLGARIKPELEEFLD